ncbi:MAG: NADH-quinone oxidoreductase subunit NuoF [bacterium]
MKFDTLKEQADKEWAEFTRADRPRILVGSATCGRAAGALQVMESFREELRQRNMEADVRMVEVGCHGLCFAEPLVEIKDRSGTAVLYKQVRQRTVPKLLDQHLEGGKPWAKRAMAVMEGGPLDGLPDFWEHPVLKDQVRIVLRNCGFIDPTNMDHYIARGGYSGIVRAFSMTPEDVIEQIKDSGIRGRGGAGFPTGVKWGFARKSPEEEKYVVCNADEGDPGAFMDRSVLEGDPHAVLEGMMIAGYAIGAAHGYVYCRAEYPLALERLNIAISQMYEKGLLGENILGSGFSYDIKIKKGAGAFVCGEETALMASIEGRRGMPRSKPPFPAASGLFGKPTNINNVETLAAVSAIMEKGAEWYKQYGTEKSRGTKTFALAGKIRNTGLIEVPMGIPLSKIIFEMGGGIPKNKRFKAVQTGGPSGGCIPPEHLNLPIDYEHLAEVGSIMGSGGMIVMDEDACMVDVAKYFLGFTEEESCGKCVPCRMGTQHMRRILEDITEGGGTFGMRRKLRAIGDTMKNGSLCGLGQTAPNPVLSTLHYFNEEYEAHIYDKRCPAAVCQGLFNSPCQHVCPVEMDVPAYIALIRAGRLEDAYKVLKRTNPFPSVCGRVCGHYCQSKCRRTQMEGPVAIRALKRFITDNAPAPEEHWVPITREEKIAVVGGGPSGLTCAYNLRKRGYRTVVFEARQEAGGMMRWGIPEYRLPRDVLRREIKEIEDTGVEIRTGTRIGEEVTMQELDEEFDFIYLALGTQKSVPLKIPGEDSEGVTGGIQFLNRVNSGEQVEVGKKVAVIGGGNTAVDAARTAVRLGADEVSIYYRREEKDMPALPEEIREAREEGVNLEVLVGPVRVIEEGGKARGIELVRMDLGDVDRSARRRPVPREGSEFTVETDLIVAAIGQDADLEIGPGRRRAGLDFQYNRIKVDKQYRAGEGKVWAGGDVVTGSAMVIDAIQAGRDAAMAIDASIREIHDEGPWEPPEEDEIDIPYMEPVEERDPVAMPELPKEERTANFQEVEKGYTLEEALREAERCLRCDYRGEQE